MAKETQGEAIPFTDIHINLRERTVTVKNDAEVVATLVFSGSMPPEGVIFLPGQSEPSPSDIDELFREAEEATDLLPQALEPLSPAPRSSAPKEKEKTVILTGKLKSKPKEGKPDRKGMPTAYADFAAHVEGEEKPHDFVATFHRHTTDKVRGLEKETQLTVSGYPHKSSSPKRKDTFSVVNLLDYPGKPPATPKPR